MTHESSTTLVCMCLSIACIWEHHQIHDARPTAASTVGNLDRSRLQRSLLVRPRGCHTVAPSGGAAK